MIVNYFGKLRNNFVILHLYYIGIVLIVLRIKKINDIMVLQYENTIMIIAGMRKHCWEEVKMDIVIGVIRDNLNGFTFDTIIILIGVINGFIFYFTRKNAKKISDSLKNEQNLSLTTYTPLEVYAVKLQELDKKCKASESSYSLFVSINSMFPLIGILGTIFALMTLVGGEASYATQESFFVALTSTFWGVLFAIIYRLADATVSTIIQSNSDEVTRLKHRDEEKQRKKIYGEEEA